MKEITSCELVDDLLRCGPQPLNVSLDYIASRFCEARLRNGCRINDVSDAAAFLHECADEVQLHSTGLRVRQSICPRCGHVHQDRECGKDMGGAGKCGCRAEVHA